MVQEIITYLGNLIRTQPYLFEGILRLRTHYIIIALREEISRIHGCNEEEAIEQLMQLSPFELKSLLSTILSGPELSSKAVVPSEQNSYIPLVITQESKAVVIKAQSGGYHAGNFAKVEINGTTMEANSRGIHVWIINLQKAMILECASFDTHISEEESQRFVDFLGSLTQGAVVVMASKDEFTEHLTDVALFSCVSCHHGHGAMAALLGYYVRLHGFGVAWLGLARLHQNP